MYECETCGKETDRAYYREFVTIDGDVEVVTLCAECDYEHDEDVLVEQ